LFGAGHLFEEPGALEQVADSAAGWFDRHLVSGGGPAFTL
jgi:putative phosphoribosyl transferase